MNGRLASSHNHWHTSPSSLSGELTVDTVVSLRKPLDWSRSVTSGSSSFQWGNNHDNHKGEKFDSYLVAVGRPAQWTNVVGRTAQQHIDGSLVGGQVYKGESHWWMWKWLMARWLAHEHFSWLHWCGKYGSLSLVSVTKAPGLCWWCVFREVSDFVTSISDQIF